MFAQQVVHIDTVLLTDTAGKGAKTERRRKRDTGDVREEEKEVETCMTCARACIVAGYTKDGNSSGGKTRTRNSREATAVDVV